MSVHAVDTVGALFVVRMSTPMSMTATPLIYIANVLVDNFEVPPKNADADAVPTEITVACRHVWCVGA